MRVAYLGTPEIAVPPLEALVAAGHDVALVVTGQDKRRGRGGGRSPSPVKSAAERLGIQVSHSLDDVVRTAGTGLGLDLGVVVAFGKIIGTDVLDAVPMVNMHFSLLPRWRGAAPVERALLAGDELTGVCIMRVEEGLDTGGVFALRHRRGRRKAPTWKSAPVNSSAFSAHRAAEKQRPSACSPDLSNPPPVRSASATAT